MKKEQFPFFKSSLERLAEVRDKIVNFWQFQGIDDTRKKLWVSDTQEVYYQMFTALDIQRQNQFEGNHDYKALQYTLHAARSRYEQVLSELRACNDYRSERLQSELQNTFEEFWKPLAIDSGIQELLSEKQLNQPSRPVFEISGLEYHLPCAICSEVAYVFRVEIPAHEEQERLIYKGITHTGDLALRYSKKIFRMLDKDQIGKAHEFLQKLKKERGIDAYCPKCNKIYCHGHYHLKEIWEAGFYDCTLGTCPEGHRRIVDE